MGIQKSGDSGFTALWNLTLRINFPLPLQLGAAKDDETDLGRHTETYGSADRAQDAIYVHVGHRVGGQGKERWVGRPSSGSVRSSPFIGSRCEERSLVEAGDIVGDKARGAQAMVEDFDLYLSAVGMTCKGKLDAQFSSPIEGIGIVREENVDHIAADERLQTGKGLLPLAAGSTFALVIDAHEIEARSLESNLCVFLAQQFHTRLCVEISRLVFRARVDFVIAVTAPDAERSA